MGEHPAGRGFEAAEGPLLEIVGYSTGKKGPADFSGRRVHLTRPLEDLEIPPTVQGILAARIDRLPADAKELLQTLAVLGREFPFALVRSETRKDPGTNDRIDETGRGNEY
jgi:hypothetical protein